MTLTELIADLGQILVDNGEDIEVYGFIGAEGFTGPPLLQFREPEPPTVLNPMTALLNSLTRGGTE